MSSCNVGDLGSRRSLGREDPLEKEMATHSSILAWRITWSREPHGQWSLVGYSPRVAKSWSRLSDLTFTFTPALQEYSLQSEPPGKPMEKKMATHTSILAWRIPWMEELGGLQSIGLQRVGHD